MNIKEYIESGMIETCVLGMASAQEQQEFEQLCLSYPEVRAARDAFELQLETTAMSNAVQPPAFLKEKIWNEISREGTGAPVVAMNNNGGGNIRTGSFFKYAAAASVLLFVASAALNFYYYNQYKDSVAKYNALVASTQEMAKNNEVQQTRLNEYERTIQLLSDKQWVPVTLNGLPASPSSSATVYWNKQTAEVYLLPTSLPAPAQDMQYQLWAIVDGKPVDAGFIGSVDNKVAAKFKNITAPQAFAITLEKKGRANTNVPEGAMYVLGKI